MAKRDFYEVLGVAKTATDADLKSAFRKAAMQCHPDRHPGDKDAERRFKELNEAYQMLSDGQKRAAYDRFGHAAFENGGGGGGFPGGGFQGGSMSDIFEDLFGDVFGGGQRRSAGGRERGADMRYNMEITLEEAYLGKSSTIKVPTAVTCEPCSGTGAKSGSKPKTCGTCGGAGRVRASQGFFAIERTCPTCGGRGEVIENPCPVCSGAGRVMKDRTLSVNIPAGVEDGHAHPPLPARARPARAAARPATSISSSRSAHTASTSARARTCSARCRSPWSPQRSAARSRCRASRAARRRW